MAGGHQPHEERSAEASSQTGADNHNVFQSMQFPRQVNGIQQRIAVAKQIGGE